MSCHGVPGFRANKVLYFLKTGGFRTPRITTLLVAFGTLEDSALRRCHSNSHSGAHGDSGLHSANSANAFLDDSYFHRTAAVIS